LLNLIKTERLNIKPLALNDAEFMRELMNSPGWIKFIGDRNLHTQTDAVNYIQKILNNDNYTCLVFKIKETEIPIGIVTIIKRDNLEHHDIGFALLPQYGKLGYSFEASKKVLDELLTSQLHTKILAITVKDNDKSISLLEKLGFNFIEEKTQDNEVMLVYST
jgi:[ribosomal protein S5]-alanine N-acetyltransferase